MMRIVPTSRLLKKATGTAKDRPGGLSHHTTSTVCRPSGTGFLACRGLFQQPARISLAVICLFLSAAFTAAAQTGAKNGEWPAYGGDLGNTHYSPLDQISAANFNKLEVAWRFKTDNLGPAPENRYETTPLMVGGVLYATAGSRRAVVALDAATGEELWMHSEREGARGEAAPRKLSGRGLAYWTDGREQRIIYDKATGKEVGAVYMPAPESGAPMTYMLNGEQYIVLAIGGAGFNSELIAFKLGA